MHLYTHARVNARARACGRSQTVLANARERKQTHANSSLRLMCGRFLCANAIAICALDLKLSGCTICAHVQACVCACMHACVCGEKEYY